MAISKVVYKSSPSATPVTWMDATTATAAAADIISPKTAMLANGVVTTGTGMLRLLRHEEITLTTTATQSNKVPVNLEIATNCLICVMIDEFPAQPDSSLYIALYWTHMYSSYDTYGGIGNAILRPAGTVGTDGYMCAFTPSTGVLQLGGQYGSFLAGTKYHIYQFEFGV